MKKLAKILLLVVTITAAFALFAVFASAGYRGDCGSNLTWTLSDAGTLTISGTGEMRDMTAGEAPWDGTGIAIKKVVINSGVTSIGDRAFIVCDKLTSVTIPSSVKTIGRMAFYGCESLTSVTIPNGVTNIETSAFSSCTNLASVTMQGYVDSIGDSAFSSCYNLSSITINGGMGSIGEMAFYSCNKLANITIPGDVISIGESAFSSCDILSGVTINGDVGNIGVRVFSNCDKLTIIKIQGDVGAIGESAFYGCTSLSDIAMQGGISSIGDSAFYSCTSLVSITIPSDTTSISAKAFENCKSLVSINVGENNQTYCSEDGVLFNKNKTTIIKYPEGKGETTYKIPDSVTKIGECAFINCETLTNMTIPDKVTTIDTYAFYYCQGLASITIPSSVTTIGDYAFGSCWRITDVYFYGTEAMWNAISIGSGNDDIKESYISNTTIHYVVKVTGITLDQTSLTLKKGEYEWLTATVLPSEASNKTVTWESSDTSVATVPYYGMGSYGEVTAIKGGTAIITATTEDGAYTATCIVTVKMPVSGVTLDKTSINVGHGSSATLTATVLPDNAANTNVIWESSNTAIATVENGVVTGIKKGSATITATTEDGGYSASCDVTVTTPATGVTLNKTSLTIKKGSSSTLSATVLPSDAYNKNVTWKSSDTSVATVSSNGVVTAVNGGSATITATTEDGGYTATCVVTVTIPVSGVSLDKTSLTIKKGESSLLTAIVSPSNAENKTVTWKSSNTSVATVSNGVVTAVGGGSATITATTEDGGYRATCAVTVTIPTSGITLNKTTLSLDKDATSPLTATVSPSDATNKNVIWKSSDTSIATVSSSGVVKAIGGGSATITATTEDSGYSATCAVTVTVPATGVTLDKSTIALGRGSSATLTATVLPSNAKNKAVTWKSSNTSVATVSSSGVVTAVELGNATITATTVDGGFEATCSVTVIVSATGIKLDKETLALDKGKSSTLTATVSPSDATNKAVTWKSSDTSVATVSSSGVVKAIGGGRATITATTEDGGYSATCSVSVTAPVTGVKLDKTSFILGIGTSSTLTATVSPSDATNKAVTWKSSNTTIATVSSSGVVKAVAKGNAIITVTTVDGGYSATCSVSVTDVVNVTGITLNETDILLGVGFNSTLTATISPRQATNKTVIWESSDTSVATVSSGGVVTAVAKGNATITATTEDGGYSASCDVTVSYGGTCGINAKWVLDDDGTLIISGTDLMDNYFWSSAPWYSSRDGIKTVIIESGVESIGSSAFENCTSLKSVIIPNSVESIESSAFYGCTSLDDVTIPDSVTLIGDNVFSGCTSLESVIIPDSVEYIDMSAFRGCTSLESVIIPDSVEYIGISAFENCTRLKSVTIPDGVTIIENSAFYGCTSLTDVYYLSNAENRENISIAGNNQPLISATWHYMPSGISLNKKELTLVIGKNATLNAIFAPENAINVELIWKSSDTSVATVSNGVVTAVALGDATITVTTEDGSLTATCAVSVKEYTPGDISGDENVTTKDVTLLRRYIAGGYNVAVIDATLDVNHDGNITTKDVTLLRRYIAGGYGVELE